MKNLLVPVDGSMYSMQAVEKAREIAAAFKSNIVLVTVSTPETDDYASSPYKFTTDRQHKSSIDRIERRKKAQAILDCAKAPLAGHDGKIETVILEGNPAEKILQYAQTNRVDLIVMGSKGMAGVNNLFIGSVTRQVALKTTRPILIVK